MPVNTTSTGATYGKSSDPLCPLGFHPQVRWPTRCKRCFRDYKEHSDDKDRARHANTVRAGTIDDSFGASPYRNYIDSDPWNTGTRTGFQKSRSVDVTQLSESRSRLGSGLQSQSAQRPNLIGAEIGSFSSRATPGATSSSTQPQTSQTDDDIPEWKRAMLERQAARNREAAAYSTPTPSATNSSDNRLSSSSSKPAIPTPISTNKPSQSSSSREDVSSAASRFRRAESEDQTLSTSFRARKSLSFEEPTVEDAASRNRRLEEAAKTASKVTFSEPSKPESKLNSYSSWSSAKTSATTDSSSSYSSSYGSSQATSSSSTSKTSSASTKPDTSTTSAPKAQSSPSWKKSTTKTSSDSSTPSTPETPKTVPSWKKQVAAPPKVEKVEEKAPSWKTPSWKQQKEAKAEESKPKLGNISESASSSSRSTAAKTKSSTSSSLENSYSASSSSVKNGSEVSSTFDRSTIGYGTSGSGTNSTIGYGGSSAGDSAKLKTLESEVQDLKATVSKLERSNSTLRKEKESLELSKGRTTPTTMTFESAKASETASELLKAKEQLREQEQRLSRLETEKKGLNLRTKELETQLERRPVASDTNKTISELQTKLKYYEKKSVDLEKENNDLLNNVQNLEQEMEEVQDNFREDEVDEYRHLKRDIEAASKNCRVLQFKLKKAEKQILDLSGEKSDLEQKVKSSVGGSSALENMNKIRQLEKDLDNKNQLNSRLEQQVKDLQNNSSSMKLALGKSGSKPGPVLSRTGSVERSVEDQLLKDLQDSIERENDLKEQLTMADESTTDMRKKLSRIEDENESLANQLKKMTKSGTRRSPSPRVSNASEDSDELSPAELKVQLEVSEGETEVLRKKVENLLTDNLKLSKEIKDTNSKLAEEKKKKSSSSLYSSTVRTVDKDNSKVDEIQNELNSTRIKLIEKERELERLDAQLKSSSKGASKMKRSGSQEDAMERKLEVIEKEANVLRDRNTTLERENEKLTSENKTLHTKYGKKPPSSTNEKLQMDKFALEEKIRNMEAKEREQNREIEKLQLSTKAQKNDTIEIDRLKREKANIEYEMNRIKANTEGEKRKVERVEKEILAANEKSEKAQRELISAERERRKVEDEKLRMEDKYGRLESELRQTTRERDRLKDECETVKQKNRDNLAQTQDGVKAFKDQIETLKKDLQDEKTKHRETRKTTDDKTRQFQNDMRTVKQELDDKSTTISDLESKVADLDEKWAKSKRINTQRKEKIDTLEKQLDDAQSKVPDRSPPELSSLRTKVRELEKDLDNKTSKITELEKAAKESPKKTWGTSSTASTSKLESENAELKKQVEDLKKKATSSTSSWGRSNSSAEVEKELVKQELEDTIAKHELLEENYVVEKAKLTMERDEMKTEYDKMKSDYGTIKSELATLRKTYNNKNDEWIKEKLNLQQRMKDLDDSLTSSTGEDWGSERDRFKNIIEDRDNQITQLKIEGDVAQSQVSAQRKDIEELKLKLQDYEKMNKFQKVVSSDDKSTSSDKQKLEEMKKQLAKEEKERKTETNNLKMKYDSKTALMSEEIMSLKSQVSKYKRDRDSYKEMAESAQKGRSGRTSATDEDSNRQRVNDLTYQMQVLEDELADSKLQCSKVNANAMAQKSNYEIAIAELNSKINELEEESLIDSGRARIAGTRTKMELAWQKERESQKKLINELNTMSRDLKSTLVEVEKERDRERLESKRKIDGMKAAFSDENDDTKKQITDLQYDLLELRDAHAKLRTTNEKLRREKEKFCNERDEYKIMVKERSRGEQGEDKKVGRLLGDMSEFLSVIPKLVGDDIMAPPKPGRTIPHTILDGHAKESLASALIKMKDAKEELEQIHKHNEEERERQNARRAMMKRTGSVEHEQDSPRGIRGGSKGRSNLPNVPEIGPGRRLSRRTGSVGETIAETDMWKSVDSRGSNESLASNASIPLPVPVRTRSAHGGGGNESGYSSDTYNAMSIRRLERDTSVDRLSTGSRESNRSAMSTASDMFGEKKKKAGLIGKLKKLTRKSEEKEFGSGSDISDVSKVSVASSAMSAFQKVQQKRGASKDRSRDKSKDRSVTNKPPEEANKPFDQYFGSGGASGSRGRATDKSVPSTPFGPSTSSSSNSSTLPRSGYRRY